jgi:hypothetical protein
VTHWKEHTEGELGLVHANAEETLTLVVNLDDPRQAEECEQFLDRRAAAIETLLAGRSRWAVLKGESVRGWLWGPLGFAGPIGAGAIGIAVAAAWLLALSFPGFMVWAVAAYLGIRLAIVKPDNRDWLSEGTVLGAGVVAAWAIRRQGGDAPRSYDARLQAALVAAPEYWHDLAGRAVERLPMQRREKLVLGAFARRPGDLWHLLPHAPTEAVVRAALARGPRSSATSDFHAFQTLVRQTSIEPVLEALRAGAGNRDVLIRAVAASGNPAAVDLLVATLAERNDRLRNVATDGLVAMGPAVLDRLFAAFEPDVPHLQRAIARVLRSIGPNREIEQFCGEKLESGDIDATAASQMRRILLTRRILGGDVTFDTSGESALERSLAQIPSPRVELEGLRWRSGAPIGEDATATLADLVASEGPELRCGELASIRTMLPASSRHALMEHAASHSEHPTFRMVLADDAEILSHHRGATKTRQRAEEWIDVLERHASLASIHALDALWRTGVDGVVQTSAMAALMRISGQYDGLETFADRALHEVLALPDHPLHESYARGQFARFEQMMVSARRLEPGVFHRLYRTIPAQHVLWGAYDARDELRGTFRLDEEYEPVDSDDEPFVFERHARIGVVHPAELGPHASCAWAEVFADYELVPHFEQLQRPACHLTVDEGADTLFTDFTDRAPSGRLEAALIQRGWRPSPTDVETVYTLTKPVQRGRLSFTAVIELDPGFGEDTGELQAIDCLAFWEGHHHVLSPVVTKIELRDVDAVVFSEIVLELRDVLATCASGEERSLPSIPTQLD